MKNIKRWCTSKTASWMVLLTAAALSVFLHYSFNNIPEKMGSIRLVAEEFMDELGRVRKPVFEQSLDFPVMEARYVRIEIRRTTDNAAPAIDEVEIFGPGEKENLALASKGAVAKASSVIKGYPIHSVEHLNNGRYGNDHSWVAASSSTEWVQIKLLKSTKIARVAISRDRTGKFRDRIPKDFEVFLSQDGKSWVSAAKWDPVLDRGFTLLPTLQMPAERLPEKSWGGFLQYAFLREKSAWSDIPADDYLSPMLVDRPAVPGGKPYWGRIARLQPLERVLALFEEMIGRLGSQGLDVSKERIQLAGFRQRTSSEAGSQELYLEARQAKRDLFFRDPALAPINRVLFVKRHPFLESHNYSEHLDGLLAPGGGIYVLNVPRDKENRFRPDLATIEQLFDGSKGIVREPVSDYDARTIYFAYRPDNPEVEGWSSYWHLYAIEADGTGLRKLTDGPFHDFDAVCLPDGGLAFHTTRCNVRFLCWRPSAYVLYRMEADGSDIRRLSFANLSEWKPSVMSDGRILWTRSEYQDKGADFGHTLWAIRPDGTHPELIFGNNTPNCYSQAHEVPGTNEIVATLMSHGGHQGPVALIDRGRNIDDTEALTNITPDARPHYQMSRPYHNTFRDPYPISTDHFLVAHNPDNHHHWSLYVIDRYGNREWLYSDPLISSMRPSPLCKRKRPPVIPGSINAGLKEKDMGQFMVQDVYMGMGSEVTRGQVKYLRVSQEVPSTLEKLSCGQYRTDYPPFTDYYATPIHLVKGPSRFFLTRTPNAPLDSVRTNVNWTSRIRKVDPGLYSVTEGGGWPSFVAKESHGTVPVAEDGSVNFLAPAGKVLYFQLLDAEYNEIQRMRSVIQLQPGEVRSCIGCHEDRQSAPLAYEGHALREEPKPLSPDPWGTGPFSYEKLVQPVLDKNCVRCHDGHSPGLPVLHGKPDEYRVPASYRTLIEGGYVHYFDWTWGTRHFKAEPLSFGSIKSRLFTVLKDKQHESVHLEEKEMRAIKTWIDLNCPLWPDYMYRLDRPETGNYVTAY